VWSNTPNGKAGKVLLDKVFKKYHLKKVFADNTYRGEFVKYLNEKYHCEVEIKLPEEKGFKVIKIRWIVERTFAWLTRNRRLAREYERNTPSSEAMVYIASSRLILKHLST
jgi:putative transposase